MKKRGECGARDVYFFYHTVVHCVVMFSLFVSSLIYTECTSRFVLVQIIKNTDILVSLNRLSAS